MKLAIVLVWFNPDKSNRNNVLNYSGFFEKTYIIDNSNKDNHLLTENIPSIKYIPNLKNTGIASALNQGCSLAFQDGFEWCMTMDQDSKWESDMLKAYISNVETYIKENKYWSFAPNSEDDKTTFLLKEIRKRLKRRVKKTTSSIPSNPDAVISSGNIINLIKWKEIGCFNEDYFIDSVDHEFCLRLTDVYPDSIIQFNNIKMIHSLGDGYFSVLTRFDFHSGVRLYYMTRNVLYLRDKYPEFIKHHKLISKLICIFFQNLRDFRYSDCFYMIQGYRAWKKNEKGSYIQH